MELANVKDELFDQQSQTVARSVYKGVKKPTLEQICPEQTLKNRRSDWRKKFKLRYQSTKSNAKLDSNSGT